jgi:hypothetical protein
MTAPTIHGLPDLSDPTPDTTITVQIPLDAWKAATSWITGSKPGGKDHPMDQLYVRFTDHPHHYTEQWDREHVDGQAAVTLQTTDKYRMSWATISDLGDPEDDNRLTYLHGQDAPGAVSVDATVALKAMRGWPTIDKEQVGVHAVQLHWDHTDRLVTLTLTNVETSTDLAQSFLPLFDGLHDFPRFPPYAHDDQLPHPVGVFGVSPGLLKALTAAAVATCPDRLLGVYGHHERAILLTSTPLTTASTLVYTTACLAPARLTPPAETPTDDDVSDEQQEVWPDA